MPSFVDNFTLHFLKRCSETVRFDKIFFTDKPQIYLLIFCYLFYVILKTRFSFLKG
jgi:hypothetical protein